MSDVLEMSVEVAARPATVWATLTEPTSFAQWMGAAMGEAALEAEVGGAVRVTFPGVTVVGEVIEIDPPRAFAFTWGYAEGGAPAPGASTVRFELAETPGGTRLTLRHAALDAGQQTQHRGGWRLYLSVLAGMAAATQHRPAAPTAVRWWLAAWNEPDAAARAQHLAACTAPEVEFRHAFAAVVGQDELSGHIASSLAHMRDMRLEADGAPTVCHGYVQMPWKVVKDGETVARGTNFGRLDLEGRFTLVVGF